MLYEEYVLTYVLRVVTTRANIIIIQAVAHASIGFVQSCSTIDSWSQASSYIFIVFLTTGTDISVGMLFVLNQLQRSTFMS